MATAGEQLAQAVDAAEERGFVSGAHRAFLTVADDPVRVLDAFDVRDPSVQKARAGGAASSVSRMAACTCARSTVAPP